MLLRVLFDGEQKYVRLSDLTFDTFMKEVCLKFNIPEGRQPDLKVFDQSDTEFDGEVFEEIVKESPGTFKVMLSKEELAGGPSRVQPRPFTADKVLSDEDVEAAIAVLKHSADEDTIREKMKATFIYRQPMVNNEKRAGDVFSVFPRFLDTPGLIEQDFRLLFGEATANKFLEKWANDLKTKVITESHGLVPTTELLDLMRNAESTAEIENGWDSDMSAILLLLHLLPPSAKGRKRPGKVSACQAVQHLIRFIKTGTSVQQHLDNISQSSQPYLLAQGPARSSIHTFFIVIDKYALPCKATGSVGALDELFKAHYVFGTSYSSSLAKISTGHTRSLETVALALRGHIITDNRYWFQDRIKGRLVL
ncbi:hypothetical protein D5F01_LYC23691 [Larimichthys crocea]|uniref:Uncharacterized protein n=1 Tax=Larimichthys crocea TaxID=215358 RepID=A0A6G0HGL1_LARCR|nr:hypothetical protein D5F01_LYC23691 [Larimichthys crocea]